MAHGSWIDPEEYREWFPEEGQTVRVEHCRPGKQKLYITRRLDGDVLLHCFHCSGRGYTSGAAGSDMGSEQRTTLSETTSGLTDGGRGGLRLPGGSSGIFGEFGGAGQEWIGRFLTPEQVTESPICWDPDSESILLPLFGERGLVGYQARRFPPREGAPKYLTKWDGPMPIYRAFNHGHSRRCVIVEDWLGAYKIALARPDLAAFPVLGTKVTALRRQYLHENFFEFVVALDNDRAEVIIAQHELSKSLQHHGVVRQLGLDCEFKDMSIGDIQRYLDEHEI